MSALALVIDLVRHGTATTRPDIVRASDLGRRVVAERVDAALRAGVLRESDVGVSTGGRPSQVLAVNENAGTILAAVFGVSRAHVALTDLAGSVLHGEFISYEISSGPDATVEALLDVLDRLRSRDPAPPLWAAVIGLPGAVDFRRGLVSWAPVTPQWNAFPVREVLQRRLQVPVWADRDANLLALGAWHETSAQSSNDVLLVKAGTTVSAGIVAGGRVQRGALGTAGDIGHLPVVDHPDVICYCGRRGCLDAVASGWAIVRDARAAADSGLAPALAAVGPTSSLEVSDVVAAARAGDYVSRDLVLRSARLIGARLADMVSMLNPATIFVGGSLSRTGELFVDEIRRTIVQTCTAAATDNLVVARIPLAHHEGVLGARSLALDEIFNEEMLRRWFPTGTPRGLAVADGDPLAAPADRSRGLATFGRAHT